MDFITEFNRFIDGLPISNPIKKQIKDYVFNLVTTDQHTEPNIEQLSKYVVGTFQSHPDIDTSMAIEYVNYILNKAITVKNPAQIENARKVVATVVAKQVAAKKSKKKE